jgi:hypothetical protein
LMVHQGTLRGVLMGGCWVGTVDTALRGVLSLVCQAELPDEKAPCI